MSRVLSICTVWGLVLFAGVMPRHASAQSTVPERRLALFDSQIESGASLKIVWLDSERVVFAGEDRKRIAKGRPFSDHPRPSDPKKSANWLYSPDQFVWNTRTGTIEYPTRPMRALCASKDGVAYISQASPDDTTLYWYYGTYGHEKRRRVSDKNLDPVNPHSCRFYEERPPWYVRQDETKHRIVPLVERHGFLDLGPSQHGGGTPVLVPRASSGKPVELRPLWNASNSWFLAYAPHANAYVAFQFSGPRAFLLRPDGSLDKAMFPASSPRNHGAILYTRHGFFYRNMDARNNVEDVAISGGYLLGKDRLERIVVGYILDEAVSPDGCKIAIAYAPSAKAHYDGMENRARGGASNTALKVVDLCGSLGN